MLEEYHAATSPIVKNLLVPFIFVDGSWSDGSEFAFNNKKKIGFFLYIYIFSVSNQKTVRFSINGRR